MASQPNHPLIVALDIGTSSTRALLYDAHGSLVQGREVKIPYEQHLTPDGGVECEADVLLKSTLRAVSRLMKLCSATDCSRVVAVATSCFWHALVGVDAGGEAVTPIYSWADTRSRSEIPALQSRLPATDYHARTGAFIHSAFWPAKISWLRHTRPDLADRVKTWLSFPDFMAMRLAGDASTSISLASATGLMNEETADWDDTTLGALSIDRSNLPQIAPPGHTICLQDAGRLAGMPDVPWYLAYGDGACSNIGAGGVSDRRIVINVSTSGAIRALCPKPAKPVAEGLFRYRMDERRWVIGGAMSNGGNVYAWLERTLRLPDSELLNRKLAASEPDGHGLTVLPFWAGERSPGWHADASATISGLNLSTTAANIAQASMESIAFTFRTQRADLLKAFPEATDLIVSGGAVEHSRYMTKLLANVMGAPVRVSLDPEPSGRGAALAVLEQLGILKDISASPDRLSKPVHPEPDAVRLYDKAFDRFQVLYDKLIA